MGVLHLVFLVLIFGVVTQVSARRVNKEPLANLKWRTSEGRALTPDEEIKKAKIMSTLGVLYKLEDRISDYIDKLEFEVFKMEYDREYSNDAAGKAKYKEYQETNNYVEQHNKRFKEGLETYELEINEFADWNDEELNKLNGLIQADASMRSEFPEFDASEYRALTLPDTVDWRTKGAVTPVKHQQQCGSCYTYAAVGSAEAAIFKNTGTLVALSTQELVDCQTIPNGRGCLGSHPTLSLQYIRDKGISTDADYPYIGQSQACMAQGATTYKIKKLETIPKGDEDAMMRALAFVGPVAIGMDVGGRDFMSFKGEQIYKDETCVPNVMRPNKGHAMLAVGYGTEDGVGYWLVKNSWGTGWGKDGYFKMLRDGKSHCLFADMSVVALPDGIEVIPSA